MTRRYQQGKRRNMTKFRLNELSAVDVPAQEGARALLLKRADPDDVWNETLRKFDDEEYDCHVVGVMTSAEHGHTHLVWIPAGKRAGETTFGRHEDAEFSHGHPWTLNAQGQLVIGEADGHTHTVDQADLMMAMMAKRQFDAEERGRLAAEGVALPGGGLPILTKADLQNAVRVFPAAGNKPLVAKHLADRAVALGASDQLPSTGELATLIRKAAPAARKEDDMSDPKDAAATELKAANDELTKNLELAKAVLALPGEQRAHFDKLDDAGKRVFLAKDADGRAAEVAEANKRATDENPIVYKSDDGTEFRKNDDPRLVKMARDRDADRKALEKAEAERETATFEKRASAELDHLPGELSARAALLKAVDGIEDEAVRKQALEALHAGNKALAKGFATYGVGDGSTGQAGAAADSPEAKLNALAEKYAADHKVPQAQAFAAVTKTDEGRALYKQYREDRTVN